MNSNKDSGKGGFRTIFLTAASSLVALVLLPFILFQVPAIQERYGWRVDFALAYLRGISDPVKPLPTAASRNSTISDPPLAVDPTTRIATIPVTPTAKFTAVITPTPTATSMPVKLELPAPEWELQDINNCGPTTLAMYLRFYGWEGNQNTIASLIKPKKEDRNVNVEELAAYVNTQVPGLEIQYRVGGDIEILKRLLAAGFPVMIEETFMIEESYWPNDDRWAGHYLLITGYNDEDQTFTGQDSFAGANLTFPYEQVNMNWQSFNRVYILVYPPESRSVIQMVLGEQWDEETNRQHAIDIAQKETEINPNDAFAWFNLGTNLIYFEKYSQAAIAYDKARDSGLPQRMLRYQFGPFFAYFNVNRLDDLFELTEYALGRTPTSEEAMLWRGWGMYRKGNKDEAISLFSKALEARPGYTDAEYALRFVSNN